jgi:NifU-like protein involved in Fe-S cluster formation
MNGIEMLLSRMIGKTPDELKSMADKVTTIIETAGTDMQEIKNICLDIQQRLERLEDGARKPNGRDKRNSTGDRTDISL